jgi:two-component system LytT family response regulator
MTEARRVVRAVIVDDEPAARFFNDTATTEIYTVDVVGEASNGREALTVIREQAPDLLFLDVQMPDQDGFSVLQALGAHVPRGVVLVTAHDEYAQRAFEVHAVDYVLKPFGRPRFMAAVERALRRLEAEDALGIRETLESLVKSMRVEASEGATLLTSKDSGGDPANRTRIGVRIGSRTTLVDVVDIDWLEADRDFVKLHVGGRVHLVAGRMRDFESMLDGGRFHRIHRSVIVNLARVRELDRERDGGGLVVLSTGVQLRVARSRWDEFERALGLEFRG